MYDLYFGDDFLGKQPETGNVISVDYLETNGALANEITSFTHNISDLGTPTVISSSSGGGDPETSEQIKFLAPKFYKSQNRAITENDYISTVYKIYPDAGSVYVYGGETVTPPQYGKVFIAIKPKTGSALTDSQKASLVKNLRDNSSVVTIIPEIVDTDYVDLVIDSKITYDPSKINISVRTLKAISVAYAFSYSSTQLGSFGNNFYYSQFVQGLNKIHSSILSNQTKIKIRKTVDVGRIVAAKGFYIDFGNSIYHPHRGHMSEFLISAESVITSNSFPHKNLDGQIIYGCNLSDDGEGALHVI